MEEQNTEIVGKKVFFLHPVALIQDEIIGPVIRNEYEAYVVKDHARMIRLLEKFPQSILFISVDSVLKQEEWEAYIRRLQSNTSTKSVRIGVISGSADPKIAKLYLTDLKVPCGYIALKQGLAKCRQIILKALELHEAKGRRKFVRASCAERMNIGFNMQFGLDRYNGHIVDLSSAGMSCIFEGHSGQELQINQKIDDIQLRLKGVLCRLKGVLAGTRKGVGDLKETVFVVIFDLREDPQVKKKIQMFVATLLQDQMSEFMATLPGG